MFVCFLFSNKFSKPKFYNVESVQYTVRHNEKTKKTEKKNLFTFKIMSSSKSDDSVKHLNAEKLYELADSEPHPITDIKVQDGRTNGMLEESLPLNESEASAKKALLPSVRLTRCTIQIHSTHKNEFRYLKILRNLLTRRISTCSSEDMPRRRTP